MTRREMLGWPILGLLGAAFATKAWGAPRESPIPPSLEIHGKAVVYGDLVVTGEVVEGKPVRKDATPGAGSISMDGHTVLVLRPKTGIQLGGMT